MAAGDLEMGGYQIGAFALLFYLFEVAFFSLGARLGLDLTAFDTQSGAFGSLEKGGDNLALREEMRFQIFFLLLSSIYIYIHIYIIYIIYSKPCILYKYIIYILTK